MTNAKIFTPSFVTLALCNFLGAMNFYLLTAIFTEYSLITYGLNYSTAALSVSLYVTGALVARVTLGGKVDGWGLKRSMIAGYALIAVTSCLYVFPLPFPALVTARFLQGAGFGIASGAAASGAVLIIPKERRAEGIGYFSMTQALATGIGPFVAIGLINLTGGYFALFLSTAIAAVATPVLAAFVKLPNIEHTRDGKTPQQVQRPRGLNRFIHTNVLPFGFVMFMVCICYAGLITYMKLYASDLGLSNVASLYFVVYAAAIIVSRPPMGKLADRRGENIVVFMTIPSLAVGFAALGAAGTWHSPALLLTSAALSGVGVGATQSVLQAVVPKVVAPNELGRGNNTYFMMMDLASGVGPVLLGLLLPISGYSAMYYLLAVWALVALGAYWLLHGRKAAGHNR